MARPSAEFLKNAIYLLDASGYIFRAYYGIQPSLTGPDGTPTHATYGFMQMLQSLLDHEEIKRCVLLWDQKERGFRHEIFPQYKANRSAPPEDLGLQLANAKIGVEALGLKQLDAPGFEADDLIATLIHHHPEENFVIVTGDKDLLQLIGPRVWCLDTMKQKWSHLEEAFEKFGVEPTLVPQVQALCGDSVDNVPGAPGVGPKTATQLMQYYKSLDAVLNTAVERHRSGGKPTDKEDPLKGKKIEAIAENVELVKVSLDLVTLSHEAPVPKDLSRFDLHEPDWDKLHSFAAAMGFSRLVEQVERRQRNARGAPAPLPETSIPVDENRFEFVRVKSLGDLERILSEHATAERVALDTETFGLELSGENDLVGFSFSFSGERGFYVPVRHQGTDQNLEPRAAVDALARFLRDVAPFCRVVFQNAKFDMHVFAEEGLEFSAERVDDTMIASFAIDPGERHGMDVLSVKHLGYTPLSFEDALGDLENFSFVDVERATRYAAEDAVVTFALWEKLSLHLANEARLQKIYSDLDAPLASLLYEMEKIGCCLDLGTLQKLSDEFHREVSGLEESAVAILKNEGVTIGPDFNIGSTKQLQKILFEDLKLPIIKKGKTGPSTDASVLEELSSHAFPRALLEIREVHKLLSTYIDAFPRLVNPRDRRLHTDFSQTIAITGRLSSSNPNLQNIPIRTERGRRIREAFCAPPGYRLLGIDYSQIELRILAHISGDFELVRAFRENADIHRRTAALVMSLPEDQVSGEHRRMAKAINFGIIYGQTPFGLAKSLGIERNTAKRFIDDYFKTYPGIRTYMDETLAEAQRDQCVKTLAGRVRYLPDIRSKNPTLRNFAERTAINSPIQGTAADMIKKAMLDIRREVMPQYPTVRLVLQIHDELLFEVPDDVDVPAFETAIKAKMEDPGILQEFVGEPFKIPMRADASVGAHWGALK